MQKMDKTELQVGQWTGRNSEVIEASQPFLPYLISGFIKMVVEYPSFAEWVPPSSGMIKINTNTTIFDDSTVGLRCVLRDAEGKILCIRCLVPWFTNLLSSHVSRWGNCVGRLSPCGA